ncbi:MAG: DegT/DnrJ/EryC1/StrS aminotransferase family protein [Treponema sp.]|nr:DegT/DnrJ/EryC1/StrS aminotransferase family protein [Treponema sp.]
MIQTFSSTIRRKEMDAVLTCMVDEKTGPGELNARFIQAVKECTGCDGAVAFRSATIALSYALKALDLPLESPIMISALAPSWQYVAVESLGYKPLVLDVNEETGLVTAEIVAEGIHAGGRLLLLHETMGIVPELEKIVALGIPVIEDISHSVGSVVEPRNDADSEGQQSSQQVAAKNVGSFGVYAIMGLEEFDTITAGGGAVLIAPRRREWSALKSFTDAAPRTDILPDINSALAFVQIKEFRRNEDIRKTIYASFQHALLSGKNRTFIREHGDGSTIWSFPVVLAGSFKDAKQYASRKEIEIRPAYEDSVIALKDEELSSTCKKAKGLYLRTVLFPLYPRLGSEAVTKITKVLGTLP